MAASMILSERKADGSVAVLTLNRPAVLNAFNLPMARHLQDELADAAADSQVRAVVLTGSGRGFCAGQDLAQVDLSDGAAVPDLGDFVRDQYNPIVLAIRTMEKPVVCAVNGVAAGAGANIALACDIVLAAREASFVQSFTKIGLVPDSGGSYMLPRLLGSARAAALLMLGDKLSADQAREWGLIWQVVDATELLEKALALAAHMAQQPTRAFALTKQLLNASWTNDLAAQLALEERLQREAGHTVDFREGVIAFVEKRKAVFLGH